MKNNIIDFSDKRLDKILSSRIFKKDGYLNEDFLDYLSDSINNCLNCSSDNIGSFPNGLHMNGATGFYNFKEKHGISSNEDDNFGMLLYPLVCKECFYVHFFEPYSLWEKFVKENELKEKKDD